ncbi:MAG TPA: GNAT family N-acetyltransferase, partial [Sphingomicrobium sp.]|nr:GNAT family N-acetyltransferase [Sphingomicrobium sp.]
MSCQPLADGELAAVVTYLEMCERPNVIVPPSKLRLRRIPNPDPSSYRALFRLVGGPWLWFSRLIMDDTDLTKIIQDPGVELFVIEDEGGIEAGMLELDFRER